jgi:hypothetical protein
MSLGTWSLSLGLSLGWIWIIEHQAWHQTHQASSIKHQASSIKHET